LYDYPLAKVPTAGWVANVAFFQLLLFAFDLIHYFRRLCLPPAYRTKTLKTLRMELLVIPGRLVTTDHRARLKLPRGYHFEKTCQYAMRRIQQLKPIAIARFCRGTAANSPRARP